MTGLTEKYPNPMAGYRLVIGCALLASGPVVPMALQAQQATVEQITVIGRQEFLEKEFTTTRQGSNVDAAKLMSQVPGGGANNNGPLTGQLQYRGMFGPRINVTIDGMKIHGGGPNWMAPPLHHIPAGLMQQLVVNRGIASITAGSGIGGTATALWKRPQYRADPDWQFTGDTEAAFGSVDSGTSYSGVVGASSANQRLYGVASADRGDDYRSPRGDVAATRYRRDVYGLGYGYRNDAHSFDFSTHRIDTEDTGTPSLPMDIDWFETTIWNAVYQGDFDGFALQIQLYGSEVNHGMSNSLLRAVPDFSNLSLPPFAGDDQRTALTASDESGFRAALDFSLGQGAMVVGIEGKDAVHHATVHDRDFEPFFVNNFNDSEVEEIALFLQWSAILHDRWYVEAGARGTRVMMDSGEVDAFPAGLVDRNPARWGMGTPPRAVWMLREAFNHADRARRDTNLDWVLKTRYQATDNLVVELGLARKVRSPMYQERYLWIPLEANAGLGDGNNYTGDPYLQPEQSQQVELGMDWDNGQVYFSPRLYRREVDDFIQGTAADNMAVIAVSRNATGDPTPLVFTNTQARFTGADMTLGIRFGTRLRAELLYSTVNGERRDIADPLYRINPDNLRVSIHYETSHFNAGMEQVFVFTQDAIALTNTLDPGNPNNNANRTDGYELTNAFFNWAMADGLTVWVGVENVFDTEYIDHLSGFNRVLHSAVPQGSRMIGPGRSLFGRLQYRW